MTKTAFNLLLISAGLFLFYFVVIIYAWVFKYFSELISKKVEKRLQELLSSFFYLEDINAVRDLKAFVKNNALKKELLINSIIYYDFIESNQALLMKLYEEIGIRIFLIKKLTSKKNFVKSLACYQLGILKIKNVETDIVKLRCCKNNFVRYNVLLALSRLGDINGLSYMLTNDSENINISYRAVIEIISVFDGSTKDLFEKAFKLSDDYIKGILIKAAVDYKIEGLREHYLEYLKSEDKNIKIACIRALCELGNLADEDCIINMLQDKDWEVRAAAAKNLKKLGTSNSLIALEKTISDSDWWVRHNSACTLISISGGREYASKIINGEDKYAREAVISAMENID